ncbi:MAG: hexose kinase [Anaerolineae bacterium]|nr:hexose kinase [Anaerolineae bacterium]
MSLRLATVTLNATLDRVLLVPDLRRGATHEVLEQVILPSGKGLNAARTARDLGCAVLGTGLLAGACGARIRALLPQYGIEDRFLELDSGESRTTTILVDPTRGETTVVYDAGPSVPPRQWPDIRQRILAAVGETHWVALCGSCPTGLPDTAYAELTAALRTRDRRVCIDARDHWLAAALDAGPFLIKCNQHEAARVTACPVGGPDQACAVARHWVQRGAAHVVISLGDQGAIAANARGAWHVVAPQVQVLSPIGSGDAMMAGLVVALQRGDTLPVATRYAVALGTANALRLGSGCCDLQAMPSLLARTEVVPVVKTER